MSIIQNDKDSLEQKSPFEGIEAPVREQIPQKLLKKLQEMNLGHKVVEMWSQGDQDRQEWLERQQKYLASWDEFLESDSSEGLFSKVGHLHLPMTYIVSKAYHARMLQALKSVEPTARARRPDASEREDAVSNLLRYTTDKWANHWQGTAEVDDQWLWGWITNGSGVKKTRWDRKFTRFVDVQEVDNVVGAEPVVDENGNTVMVPEVVRVEEEVTREVEVYSGPVEEVINIEDIIFIGSNNPQNADAVLHRQYLTKSDLYTYAYQNIFDLEAVEAAIESGKDYKYGSDSSTDIKSQRSLNAGHTSWDTRNELDRYEILEAWLKVDIDQSGIDSDIVVWVHKTTKQLLRATYVYRITRTGKRPFHHILFQPRKDQPYGIGLPELMYPLQKELDFFHNLRVEFGMISTAPVGFYRASSSLDPKILTYQPGDLIPVNDPMSDIVFPQMGNRTSFGAQEEASILSFIERLTSVSDMTTGALTGVQGPMRTATGARAFMSENNANLDVFLKRLFRGVRSSYEYMLNLLQLNVSSGFAYKVTGENGSEYWDYIKGREDIAGDFDFDLNPSSAASNPDVRREKAQSVLQIAANPLYLQTGLVTSSNLYNALRDFLKAFDVQNFSRYISQPQGYSYQLTPEETANRVLRGIPTPALPTDDLQGFIAFVDNIMSTDELLGQFNEQEIQALVAARMERQQLIQAMEAQRAQTANQQQMMINMANPVIGANPLSFNG